MANFFTNATDITPGTTGAWVDVDLSASIPADATGVIIQQVVSSVSLTAWGARKKGSTDGRTDTTDNLNWAYVGVDGSRIVQLYRGTTNVLFKLLGYFTSDGTFFTDAYNKTPGTTGSWADVDCSAQIPAGAKFAAVELVSSANNDIGLRAKGSTDNRKRLISKHTFALVPLDTNRIFQFYGVQSTDKLYLVGYITSGTLKVNGVNVTPTADTTYKDIDRSGDSDAASAIGVIVEIYDSTWSGYFSGIREKGSTDDFYKQILHSWGVVGLDAGKIFQGKIQSGSTSIQFFITGYLSAPPPPTWEYIGNTPLTLSLQSEYGFPITKEYVGNTPLTLTLQSVYSQEWQYQGSIPLTLIPESNSSWFLGWEYIGGIPLSLSLASDYFAVLGRNPIPVPYVLRYPSPRNGQTNVPIKNGIRFKIQSDTAGIDIDTVRVKITDSQGINTYDRTSPYFKYSGTKYRYEVEVRPPQPWAYEEDVQAEIDAWDLAVPPVQGVVYEYIP